MWVRDEARGRGAGGGTGLKPYQPIQRMKVPRTWKGVDWPGIGTGWPASSKRPMRGPMKIAPQSAATPPVKCTTPEPAKSRQPPRTVLSLSWVKAPERKPKSTQTH